jgi:hypothetical protein
MSSSSSVNSFSVLVPATHFGAVCVFKGDEDKAIDVSLRLHALGGQLFLSGYAAGPRVRFFAGNESYHLVAKHPAPERATLVILDRSSAWYTQVDRSDYVPHLLEVLLEEKDVRTQPGLKQADNRGDDFNAEAFVEGVLRDFHEEKLEAPLCPQDASWINEYCTRKRINVRFDFDEFGPPHMREFECVATLGAFVVTTRGGRKHDARIRACSQLRARLQAASAGGRSYLEATRVGEASNPGPNPPSPVWEDDGVRFEDRPGTPSYPGPNEAPTVDKVAQDFATMMVEEFPVPPSFPLSEPAPSPFPRFVLHDTPAESPMYDLTGVFKITTQPQPEVKLPAKLDCRVGEAANPGPKTKGSNSNKGGHHIMKEKARAKKLIKCQHCPPGIGAAALTHAAVDCTFNPARCDLCEVHHKGEPCPKCPGCKMLKEQCDCEALKAFASAPVRGPLPLGATFAATPPAKPVHKPIARQPQPAEQASAPRTNAPQVVVPPEPILAGPPAHRFHPEAKEVKVEDLTGRDKARMERPSTLCDAKHFYHCVKCPKPKDTPMWASDLDIDFARGTNGHPFLGLNRAYCEWCTWGTIALRCRDPSVFDQPVTVAEVGGTTRSAWYASMHKITYHSMNPPFLGSDVFRERPAGHCTQMAPCACVEPDVYMWSHVYELAPHTIRQMLLKAKRGIGFGIYHHHEAMGTFEGGEARYWRAGNGQIYQDTVGGQVYQHPDTEWLRDGFAKIGDQYLVWNAVHDIGSMIVYEFRLSPVPGVEKPKPTVLGPISGMCKVGDKDVYNTPTALYLYTERDTNPPIRIPTGLLRVAITRFLSVSRDNSGKQAVYTAMASAVKNYPDFPVERTTHLVELAHDLWSAGVISGKAFADDTVQDVTAREYADYLLRGVAKWQWAVPAFRNLSLGVHRRAQTYARNNWKRLSVTGICLAIVMLYALWWAMLGPRTLTYGFCVSHDRYESHYWQQPTRDAFGGCYYGAQDVFTKFRDDAATKSHTYAFWQERFFGPLLFTIIEESFLACGWWARSIVVLMHSFHDTPSLAMPFHIVTAFMGPAGPAVHLALNVLGARLDLAASTPWLGLAYVSRVIYDGVMPEIEKTDTLDLSGVVDREDNGKVPEPVGIHCSIPPVVTALNAVNEEAALRGRLLQPHLEVTVDAKHFEQHVRSEMKIQRGTKRVAAKWYPWWRRFPANMRKVLTEAKAAFKQGLISYKTACARKAFLKYEKLLKFAQTYFPRLIESCHPAFNAMVGPWVYAFSKVLAEEWNPDRDGKYAYAAGASAESLGEWADRNQLGGHWRIIVMGDDSVVAEDGRMDETDFSVYDSTIRLEFVVAILNVLRDLYGMPQYVWQWTHDTFVAHYGYTRFGIKYATTSRQTTGSPWTSVLNSIYNAMVQSYSRTYNVPMTAFGMKPKTQLGRTIDEVGFLSGRFYAVQPYVRNGVQCDRVYGPDIPKQLAKFGWDIVTPPNQVARKLQMLRGETIGHRRDWNFLPLLSVVRDQTELLCGQGKVATVRDFRIKTALLHEASECTLPQCLNLWGHGDVWQTAVAQVKMAQALPFRLTQVDSMLLDVQGL